MHPEASASGYTAQPLRGDISELSLRPCRSSGMRLFALVLVVVLSVALVACKDDPVTTKPPNSSSVIIRILPDSGFATVDSATPFTIQVVSGALPTSHTLEWSFDSGQKIMSGGDTINHTFSTLGQHGISVTAYSKTGSVATAHTTITDTLLHIKSNDTSSHDFVWTEFTSLCGQINMTGCWVSGPNDIWTVNDKLCHFDGTTWTVVDFYDPKYPIEGLSGMSLFGLPGELWMADGGAIARLNLSTHNATVWRFLDTSQYGYLHAVWGLASNDLYAVADKGMILHFDGSTWSKMKVPGSNNLQRIWGTADNNIWAAGYNYQNGESEVWHYTGSYWTTDNITTSGASQKWGLGSMWACDSAGHSFVASGGTTVFRRTDNNNWRNDSLLKLTDHIGLDLSGTCANDIFAVGSWGLVMHWNGRSWKRYDQFLEESNNAYLTDQVSMNSNTVCIVGLKNYTSWVLIGQRK
jgi:hypothetical protein